MAKFTVPSIPCQQAYSKSLKCPLTSQTQSIELGLFIV